MHFKLHPSWSGMSTRFINLTSSDIVYLVAMTLIKFRVIKSWTMAIALIPSSSRLYSSAHISMRTVTGILWSSGNSPISMKHSFSLTSSNISKLCWRRQSKSVLLDSRMDWLFKRSFISSHFSKGWLRSDPAMTFSTNGEPLQAFTLCA